MSGYLGPNLAPPPQVMDLSSRIQIFNLRSMERNAIHLGNIRKFDEIGENLAFQQLSNQFLTTVVVWFRIHPSLSDSQWVFPVWERLDKHSTSCIPCYDQHETSKSSHGRKHCDLAWFYSVFQLRLRGARPPCNHWASCHQMSVQRRPLILVHCCAYGPDRFPLAT